MSPGFEKSSPTSLFLWGLKDEAKEYMGGLESSPITDHCSFQISHLHGCPSFFYSANLVQCQNPTTNTNLSCNHEYCGLWGICTYQIWLLDWMWIHIVHSFIFIIYGGNEHFDFLQMGNFNVSVLVWMIGWAFGIVSLHNSIPPSWRYRGKSLYDI